MYMNDLPECDVSYLPGTGASLTSTPRALDSISGAHRRPYDLRSKDRRHLQPVTVSRKAKTEYLRFVAWGCLSSRELPANRRCSLPSLRALAVG